MRTPPPPRGSLLWVGRPPPPHVSQASIQKSQERAIKKARKKVIAKKLKQAVFGYNRDENPDIGTAGGTGPPGGGAGGVVVVVVMAEGLVLGTLGGGELCEGRNLHYSSFNSLPAFHQIPWRIHSVINS